MHIKRLPLNTLITGIGRLFKYRLVKYHGNKTKWVIDAWTETWLSPEFSTWNLDDYIQEIHCPILVIHRVNDEYATLAQPQRFIDYAASTKKSLEILNNCEHFPHKEKEQEVLQIIQQFIKDSLSSQDITP